jgi:hypothetical protein
MSARNSPTTRRFVRTAWIMLIFQLFAAAGAVGAAVWAFGAVRTLVNERAVLQARVTEREAAQNRAAPASPVEPVATPVDAPVAMPAPAPPTVMPTPAPTPPVRPGRPPQARPSVEGPPVETPPVEQPPVYTPPPYTPPPRVEDKPPPSYDPPPQRPRRPRLDVPGIIGGIIGGLQDRPRRPNTPTRPPGTGDTPNGTRPPATNVPGTTQPPRTTGTNPILRRVPPRRPATTTVPQEPVVR